jgi:hypothetical protein
VHPNPDFQQRYAFTTMRLRDGKAHVFLVLGQLGRCHGLRLGGLLQRSKGRRGSCPGDDNSAGGQAIHGRDPCVVTLEALPNEQETDGDYGMFIFCCRICARREGGDYWQE